MNRRNAIKTALGVAAVSAAGLRPAAANDRPVLKPARLKPGMTVGIIAPASSTGENEDIHTATEIVQSLGFKTKHSKNLFARSQYLAGSDRGRADDVNAMFGDDGVDAIICLRGGYGTPRILPYLDYDIIRANPKVLLGYSDITGLLTAIHTQTGMVVYHGPTAHHSYSDYSLAEFQKVLMKPDSRSYIGAPPPFETAPGRIDMKNRLTTYVPGKARGRLLGGNLTLLTSLMGSPYEPDFRGRILFLEDVGEAPYRIDRMLTQLWLAGRLQEVAGIAFGKFTDADPGSGNSFSIEEIIHMRCDELGVPVLRGLMIGHVADQTVVPIGVEAELDADRKTLRLLETPVT